MKKKAFTLIELLVVISIIALLVSILMPALSKARKSAKSVVCMSNLKQWATISVMYTGDNDDTFWYDGPDSSPGASQQQAFWMKLLSKYASDVQELRFCPMAIKISPINNACNGATFEAWNAAPHVPGIDSEYSSGSYGTNLWLSPVINTQRPGWGFPGDVATNKAYHWGKTSAKNSTDIPVIGDCVWFGVEPFDYQSGDPKGVVSAEKDYFKNHKPNVGTGSFQRYMDRICLDRHSRAVNWGFMDGSGRKVQLEDLWTLRWHKKYKRADNVEIPWL
ncbi:MAG: type II secretion system protein [Phycisphaerae bacterium]|nr:type II secretion system protein [Phycisphaerae bacterium]